MTEEKINTLQGNLDISFIGSLSFLKKNNLSLEDYGYHVGEIASQTWPSEQMTMEQIVQAFERNFSILKGAEVKIEKSEEKEAIISIKGYPQESLLQMAGLSRDDVKKYFALYQPVAEKQKLKISVKEKDGKFTMIMKR